MAWLLLPGEAGGLLSMAEAIEAVEAGFRGFAEDTRLNVPRQRVHAPTGVRVSVHQGAVPVLGHTGLMVHCELPRILPDRGIQQFAAIGQPVTVLYNAETAQLAAVIFGSLGAKELPAYGANALRTAATSAVGIKYLARRDAAVAGVLGSGGQARHHLVALCRVRPIREVRVYSPTRANREQFAEEMSRLLGIVVRPANGPREVVQGVDVLLSVTNANAPVFEGAWLEPGVHLLSFQASDAGLVRAGTSPVKRRDVDEATIARAEVVVLNSRAQAVQDQQSDVSDAVERGLLTWDRVWELGELLLGKVPGRTDDRQVSWFNNNAGQGVADVALGAAIYKKARAAGIGRELPLPEIAPTLRP